MKKTNFFYLFIFLRFQIITYAASISGVHLSATRLDSLVWKSNGIFGIGSKVNITISLDNVPITSTLEVATKEGGCLVNGKDVASTFSISTGNAPSLMRNATFLYDVVEGDNDRGFPISEYLPKGSSPTLPLPFACFLSVMTAENEKQILNASDSNYTKENLITVDANRPKLAKQNAIELISATHSPLNAGAEFTVGISFDSANNGTVSAAAGNEPGLDGICTVRAYAASVYGTPNATALLQFSSRSLIESGSEGEQHGEAKQRLHQTRVTVKVNSKYVPRGAELRMSCQLADLAKNSFTFTEQKIDQKDIVLFPLDAVPPSVYWKRIEQTQKVVKPSNTGVIDIYFFTEPVDLSVVAPSGCQVNGQSGVPLHQIPSDAAAKKGTYVLHYRPKYGDGRAVGSMKFYCNFEDGVGNVASFSGDLKSNAIDVDTSIEKQMKIDVEKFWPTVLPNQIGIGGKLIVGVMTNSPFNGTCTMNNKTFLSGNEKVAKEGEMTPPQLLNNVSFVKGQDPLISPVWYRTFLYDVEENDELFVDDHVNCNWDNDNGSKTNLKEKLVGCTSDKVEVGSIFNTTSAWGDSFQSKKSTKESPGVTTKNAKETSCIIDSKKPSIVSAKIVNTTSTSHIGIGEEMLILLNFKVSKNRAQGESGLHGLCRMNVENSTNVIEQFNRTIVESLPNAKSGEVKHYVQYIVEEGDQDIHNGDMIALECLFADEAGNPGRWSGRLEVKGAIQAHRPVLAVGRVFSTDNPAHIGSSITIVLRTGRENEVLSSPEGCSVNGRKGIPITSGGGGYYQVIYNVEEGDAIQNRTLPFFCKFEDDFGNANSIADIFQTEISIDPIPPRIDRARIFYTSNRPAKMGDVVQIALEPPTESLADPIFVTNQGNNGTNSASCTIHGQDVSKSFAPADNMYMLTYLVKGGVQWEKGSLDINCTLWDAAGNYFIVNKIENNDLQGVDLSPLSHMSVQWYLPDLAVIGFILISIAAYTLGEKLSKFRLPRISVYIFIGILSGPYVLGLVESEQMEGIRGIDEMALAFIGMTAGAKLDFDSLGAQNWEIFCVVLGLVIVEYIVGAGTILMFSSQLDFFLGMTSSQMWAIALLAGAMMTARSPSTALAIIDQTGAKGKFTSFVLAVTIIMDVVVIMLYDINALVAESLLSENDGTNWDIFGPLFVSFFIAFVGGTFFGYSMRYLAFWEGSLRRDSQWAWTEPAAKMCTLMGIGVVCFLIYHTVNPWFEPIIFLMVASAVVRNWTPHGHEFTSILKNYSNFVYVPFFTLAGVALRLDVFAQSIIIAAILAFTRVCAICCGSILGMKFGNINSDWQPIMWMTFVTQAGVTLGLAKKVQLKYVGWGSDFATVIVSVVILNQIIGPFLMKSALHIVGDTSQRKEYLINKSERVYDILRRNGGVLKKGQNQYHVGMRVVIVVPRKRKTKGNENKIAADLRALVGRFEAQGFSVKSRYVSESNPNDIKEGEDMNRTLSMGTSQNAIRKNPIFRVAEDMGNDLTNEESKARSEDENKDTIFVATQQRAELVQLGSEVAVDDRLFAVVGLLNARDNCRLAVALASKCAQIRRPGRLRVVLVENEGEIKNTDQISETLYRFNEFADAGSYIDVHYVETACARPAAIDYAVRNGESFMFTQKGKKSDTKVLAINELKGLRHRKKKKGEKGAIEMKEMEESVVDHIEALPVGEAQADVEADADVEVKV